MLGRDSEDFFEGASEGLWNKILVQEKIVQLKPTHCCVYEAKFNPLNNFSRDAVAFPLEYTQELHRSSAAFPPGRPEAPPPVAPSAAAAHPARGSSPAPSRYDPSRSDHPLPPARRVSAGLRQGQGKEGEDKEGAACARSHRVSQSRRARLCSRCFPRSCRAEREHALCPCASDTGDTGDNSCPRAGASPFCCSSPAEKGRRCGEVNDGPAAGHAEPVLDRVPGCTQSSAA